MKKFIEENFELFFNNLNDLFLVTDINGTIIEANFAAHKILTLPKQELINKSISSFCDTASQQNLSIFYRSADNNKQFNIRLLSSKDTSSPIDVTLFQLVWKNEICYLVANQIAVASYLTTDKFSSFLSLTNAIAFIAHANTGTIVLSNRLLSDTLGYSSKKITGKTTDDIEFFRTKLTSGEIVASLKQEGSVSNLELELNNAKKKAAPFLCSFNLLQIGNYELLLFAAIDIKKLKLTDKDFNYYLNQQKLIAEISQTINPHFKLDESINDVLQEIGLHTGMSRVYIIEESEDGLSGMNTHEWCNNGIPSLMLKRSNIRFNEIPTWKKRIEKEGYILASDVSELPADLSLILSGLGIKSLLVLPLIVNKALFGYIGFEDCVEYQRWKDDEIDLLRTLSGIIANTFEREKAFLQIKESEMRLNMAIDGSNEGLWDWSITDNNTWYNEYWYTMLGYELTDISSNPKFWESIIHPDDYDMVITALNDHLHNKSDIYKAIYRLKDKSGSWKWILAHGKVVLRDKNDTPTRMIGTHIDITQQKETELKQLELISTRDKLFSIIAHDLRGPIGTLLQVLELLTSKNDIDEETQRDFLEELKKMSESTFQLLENLLSWSKSQRNEIIFLPEKLYLTRVIKENIHLLKGASSQKEIKIEYNSVDDSIIFADLNMVNLVIRNLLSNALKFSPRGSVITISSTPLDSHIEVAISDQGIGIPQERINTMFGANKYVTTRGTENEAGSGLGLLLCKDFVERNQGTIRVESKQGEGSTFRFTLPRQ